MEKKSFKTMRWLTLVLQLVSVAFSYTAYAFGVGSKTITEIVSQYRNLFWPAEYTLGIWTLVRFAMLIYCIYQLLPSQAGLLAYERINKYVRFTAIMSIAWQIAFRYDLILASAIIILFMLVSCVIMFARAHYTERRRSFSLWLTVPFSLYLGWTSVLAMANIALWLRSRNVWWNGAGISDEMWVVIVLAILLLITQSVSNNFKDYVFALIVTWFAIGIWVALKNNDIISANASLGAAIIAFLIAIVAFIKRMKLLKMKDDKQHYRSMAANI